jgi:hypothetical protein
VLVPSVCSPISCPTIETGVAPTRLSLGELDFDAWYMSEELTDFLVEKWIEVYVVKQKGDRIGLSDDSRTDVSLSE